MSLFIYNTLSQKKEEFVPLHKNKVQMYVCGPTVYNFIHVGNARAMVFFDVVYRYLVFKGYEVTYVRNITDIDDKIIQKAEAEKQDSTQIAQYYTAAFNEDMKALNLVAPTYCPKATEHIDLMIIWVQKLLEKGCAYQTQGEVLFSVEKIKTYILSKKNAKELMAGARVEVAKHKKNPGDFILWKPSKPGEPSWESPWGKGRPGWHLECSVMSTKYLGDTLDIHGGGRDLIFPHHENEIIQSESFTGKPFVKYWMHNEMLSFGKEKMSKSLGNIVMARDFLRQYPAEVLKFMLLSNHYRSSLEFRDKAIRESILSLEKIYKTLLQVQRQLNVSPGSRDNLDSELKTHVLTLWDDFEKAMDDDFNIPKVLGALFDAVRVLNRYLSDIKEWGPEGKEILENFLETIKKMSSIWGLFEEEPEKFLNQLRLKLLKTTLTYEEIEKLISQRLEARQKKDWKMADEIRNFLEKNHILLEDTPSGTTWKIAIKIS